MYNVVHNVHRTFVVQSYNTDTKIHQVLFHPFKDFYGDKFGMLLIHIYLRICGWIRDACVFGECKCVCVIGEMYKIQY